MSRMLESQKLALESLRFVLSLRNKQEFKKLFDAAWYDKLLVEYIDNVMTITVLAGDQELGHNTYMSSLYNELERIELCDSRSFEGLTLNFGGDAVAVLFNACREFAGNKELMFGMKLVRVNKTQGSFELSIKGQGTVFINYKITVSLSGISGIHISNISASWNPMVTPQVSLRVS